MSVVIFLILVAQLPIFVTNLMVSHELGEGVIFYSTLSATIFYIVTLLTLVALLFRQDRS